MLDLFGNVLLLAKCLKDHVPTVTMIVMVQSVLFKPLIVNNITFTAYIILILYDIEKIYVKFLFFASKTVGSPWVREQNTRIETFRFRVDQSKSPLCLHPLDASQYGLMSPNTHPE